jgi:hypothetical protein
MLATHPDTDRYLVFANFDVFSDASGKFLELDFDFPRVQNE